MLFANMLYVSDPGKWKYLLNTIFFHSCAFIATESDEIVFFFVVSGRDK